MATCLETGVLHALALPPAGVCHEKIRAIVEYWKSIHPESGLPGRQHFDSCSIPELRRKIALIDVVGEPLRFRIRFLGPGIGGDAGEDNAGKWVAER